MLSDTAMPHGKTSDWGDGGFKQFQSRVYRNISVSGMLQCETASGISTPWSLLLLVSVLPTEKYTIQICVRWILCFAGCCVPLLGHLVTWIGRCRGMTSFIIGMNEWNSSQVAMAKNHGLPCVWDNTGNLLTIFLTCQGRDGSCVQ